MYVTEGRCWGQAGQGVTVATPSQGAGGQPEVQCQVSVHTVVWSVNSVEFSIRTGWSLFAEDITLSVQRAACNYSGKCELCIQQCTVCIYCF